MINVDRAVRFAGALAILASPLFAQTQETAEVVSLGRALQVALDNSQILRDAEFDLVIADQQVREAWSAVLPDVRATASYSRNLRVQQFFLPAAFFDPNAAPGELTPVRVGSDNTWLGQFSASQALFEMDALIGLGAAGQFSALQEERVRGTAQEVVTAVRLAYFNALLAAEDIRLTEESIRRIRGTLGETQAMNRAGLASEYDVLRLEVQLGNLEPNLRRAEYAFDAAKRTLLVEMGLDPLTPIELEGRLNEIDIEDLGRNDPANAALVRVSGVTVSPDTELDEVVRLALDRRSDVRQLEATILLEEARRKAEKSEYFPKLSVFANYNVTAQQDGGPVFFGDNSNQRTTTAIAGLQVELPIFTGFSRDARVQQSRALVAQNEVRLERLKRQTANELQTLIDNLQEARERASSQRRAVAQAERGFEIASAEFNAGIGSRLATTEAELALRQSEFNYAQAVYDYLSTRARLERAAGTVPDVAGTFADIDR